MSWAATSDVGHLENTYGLNAIDFFTALGDASSNATKTVRRPERLHIPEHRDDIKEDLEDDEEEDDTVQARFIDF